MQINLGTKIRELRHRDSRTQEELAQALDITPQAVSRWENSGSYPDMNLIPAIANYFGVSIDELFGYSDDRTRRIEELVDHVQTLLRENRGEDVNIAQCLLLVRDAMIEFPGNEKLMLCLASVLYKAGGVRYGEYHLTDEEGYSVYDTKRHREYAEWQEAIKLYEKVLPTLPQGPQRHKAVDELSQLYVNMGYHEKAMELAQTAPDILGTKEFLKIYACDGKEQAKAYGEAILTFVQASAALAVNAVLAYDRNLTAGEKVQALQGAIGLFDQMCPDGNFGEHTGFLSRVYMLLSAYLWLDGKKEDAFGALDQASLLAKQFEGLCSDEAFFYTVPLLRLVKIDTGVTAEVARDFRRDMAEDWPWWDAPELKTVKKEMQTDPCWEEWMRKLLV